MDVPLLTGWERGYFATMAVRERLRRITSAWNKANVSYAVIGDNAVAAWVGRVDEAAIRASKDVEVLLLQPDLPAAVIAAETVGFVCQHGSGVVIFLDGKDGRVKDAIRVRATDEFFSTEDASDNGSCFHVLSFEPLVRMMLTSWRYVDKMHLRDLIDVGLLDETWPARFPTELAERLQLLLDTPDG